MIAVQEQVKAVLKRFVDRVIPDENVWGVYSVDASGELHVWVLLYKGGREEEYRVIAAQFETDPDLLLTLWVTDQNGEIPENRHVEFERT